MKIISHISFVFFIVFISFCSYIDLIGIRLLPLVVVIFYVMNTSNGLGLVGLRYWDFISFIFILTMVFVLSVLNKDMKLFTSVSIFFLIAYWPLIFNRDIAFSGLFYLKIYTMSALGVAVGLIIQRLLFDFYSILIGKIDFMADRIGFGFTWDDYSYLSLYLASATVFVNKVVGRKFLRFVFISVLLLGSFLTTARTGIFALFVFLAIVFLFQGGRDLFRLKINIKFYSLFVIGIGFGYLLLSNLKSISTRSIDFSDSERFENYSDALAIIANKPMFGLAFDFESVGIGIKYLPHNLFLYIIMCGGIVFFIITMMWMVFLFARAVRSNEKDFVYFFIITFIGLQFVPSFYSAYYIALLISIFNITQRSKYLGVIR